MNLLTPRRLQFALLAFGVSGLLVYAFVLAAYVTFPYYLDHVEPAIASVACLLFEGLELYPSDITRAPGGLQYGPYSYVPAALLLSVYPDALYAPKVAGGLAGALAVATLTCFFRRQASWKLALTLGGAVAWWLLSLRLASLWARPDPFMLLAVSLGVGAVTWKRERLGALAVGVLLGVSIGVKVHGFLPFLPLLCLLWHQRGWSAPALASATGAAVALAPFAFPNIALEGLIDSLFMASRHGFEIPKLIEVPVKALPMILPPAVLLLLLRRSHPETFREEFHQRRWFWIALPVSLALGILIASKAGAGAGHLVPFAPLFAFATFRVARRIEPSSSEAPLKLAPWTMAGIVYIAALLVAVAEAQDAVWGGHKANRENLRLIRSDLEEIIAQFPGKRFAMGFGDGPRYVTTMVRADLVCAGHPYLVEPVAVMDLQASGRILFPAHLLNPQITDFWLIPIGERPFAMENGYGTGPLFSAEFTARFATAWQPVARSHAFDLWAPREAPPDPPAPAPPHSERPEPAP